MGQLAAEKDRTQQMSLSPRPKTMSAPDLATSKREKQNEDAKREIQMIKDRKKNA